MVTYSEKEKDSGIGIQPTKVLPATICSWIYWALWVDTLWDCPGKVTERRWISSRVFSGVISQKQNKNETGNQGSTSYVNAPEIRLLTCNQFYLCPKGLQADMMIHRLKMIIPLHSLFLHHQMPSRFTFSCLNCCKSVLIDPPSSSLTSFKYVFHIAVNSDLASLLNSQKY